jgi:mannose-1-phosphate guanylyltransferase
MADSQEHTYIIIMAGGAGTRFWPASTEEKPKQFLDILGLGRSLLQMTYDRFLQLVPVERIFIVTNEKYEGLVRDHLPELHSSQIICEPSRNNTAPCIAYATLKITALNPQANFVISPSDHLILRENQFIDALKKALHFTGDKEAICTLGIHPSRPDTGYGYIQYESSDGNMPPYPVASFKEKPDLETAESYIKAGNYVWNAGIFIFSATTIQSAFQRYAPEILNLLKDIPYHASDEMKQIREWYPQTPNISVDYAIMERADNVYTIPVDIGWSDLGTWASLYAELEKDTHANAVRKNGILTQDCEGNLIRTREGKQAIIRGLSNFVVIDEENALLIYPMAAEQEIKAASTSLKTQQDAIPKH